MKEAIVDVVLDVRSHLMNHVMVGNMHMTYKIHGIQAAESRSFVLLAVF